MSLCRDRPTVEAPLRSSPATYVPCDSPLLGSRNKDPASRGPVLVPSVSAFSVPSHTTHCPDSVHRCLGSPGDPRLSFPPVRFFTQLLSLSLEVFGRPLPLFLDLAKGSSNRGRVERGRSDGD